MKETRLNKEIDTLYNKITSKVFQVYNIFKDFFGNEHVDLQQLPDRKTFESYLINAPISEYVNPVNAQAINPNVWMEIKDISIYNVSKKYLDDVIKLLSVDAVVDSLALINCNNSFILVYFPKVTVTNEHDRSTDIFKLFVKVGVCWNGSMQGRFQMNKSAYTMIQMKANYVHSHCPRISSQNDNYDFTRFSTPCTGSGPINSTMSYLFREYDEDMWNMFCLELSKYVTVESLVGGPYIRLEELESYIYNASSAVSSLYVCNSYPIHSMYNNLMKEFIRYFVNKGILKFNFRNGNFSLGMSFIDYMVTISNVFIEWYNNKFNKKEVDMTLNELIGAKIIKYCNIAGSNIYFDNSISDTIRLLNHIGKPVCTFKGEEIKVEIIDKEQIKKEKNKSIILNCDIAMFILTRILRVLNYRYGRENTNSNSKARYL